MHLVYINMEDSSNGFNTIIKQESLEEEHIGLMCERDIKYENVDIVTRPVNDDKDNTIKLANLIKSEKLEGEIITVAKDFNPCELEGEKFINTNIFNLKEQETAEEETQLDQIKKNLYSTGSVPGINTQHDNQQSYLLPTTSAEPDPESCVSVNTSKTSPCKPLKGRPYPKAQCDAVLTSETSYKIHCCVPACVFITLLLTLYLFFLA